MDEPLIQNARGVERSPHFLSLFLTLSVFGLPAINSFCPDTDPDNEDTDDTYGFCYYYGVAIIFLLPIAYIGYWIECCCSGSSKFLSNDMEIVEYEGFMTQITTSAPRIGTAIACYHIETRVRIVNYTDANGYLQTRTETYTERVTTYTGEKHFDYRTWDDVTGQIVGVIGGGLVRLDVSKTYRFGDNDTAEKFEEHRKSFVEENRHLDVHIDDWTIFEVPGHRPKVLVRNGGTERPLFLHAGCFWLFSLFMLTWPYRIWFDCATNPKHITLRKVIYA